ADPDVVVAVAVPAPVAGDPDHGVALGLLLRRHFLDRLRRLLGHDRAGLGLEIDGLGVGLVDRTALQHLHALGRRLELVGRQPAAQRENTTQSQTMMEVSHGAYPGCRTRWLSSLYARDPVTETGLLSIMQVLGYRREIPRGGKLARFCEREGWRNEK